MVGTSGSIIAVVEVQILMTTIKVILQAGEGVAADTSDLDDISLGTDEGDAAVLPIHQHLPPEVLTQQVLQHVLW